MLVQSLSAGGLCTRALDDVRKDDVVELAGWESGAAACLGRVIPGKCFASQSLDY